MKKILLALLLLAPLTMSAQKFGCVEYEAIASALPEFAKANGELQALAKQYENELKAMQDELNRKFEEYKKTSSTMNETKRQEVEQQLQDMNEKIQESYTQNQQTIQQKQQELLAHIQSKVAQAIENVGKNGQYVLIVPKGSLPYISATLCEDVTEACKTEVLNIK